MKCGQLVTCQNDEGSTDRSVARI